ncbi:3-isopropylmalate dehydratase small subunit [Novosphingobium sp. MW5]|nr:3-isopropylmalate dehydratase small subunit [Novosphingobium sp. MW5]
MKPFTTLTSVVAPLSVDNVDTDTIIPSREMKSTGRTGLADGLFAPWRYTHAAARTPNPDFVLNRPEYANAEILAAGCNFGCGSSREHAVWALAEWGIRAIVAESFAPIFYQNCIRNGILPIVANNHALAHMAGAEVTIDLARQVIVRGATEIAFQIGEEAKTMLLEGLDAIDLTLKSRADIDARTQRDRQARPWVYLS